MISVDTLADPEHGRLDPLIDLERYPLESPTSPAWRSLVEGLRSDLVENGLVTLPGFLRPEALRRAAEEISAIAPHVPIRRHRACVYHRPALAEPGESSDPRGLELEWFAGHVTRDMIPPYAYAHRLYASAFFKQFIAACVGQQRVFEYADPLAGLVATVLPPDGTYPWHYDTNEFVVTIMVQAPEAGGDFEYVQNLRSPGHENLSGLSRVIQDGDRSQVQSVATQPGDLQLFLGRYSLHQVTQVHGDRARHVLVLSYADRPGVIGPVDRTRSVYGRVTEAHLLAEQVVTADNDGLIL